MRGAHYLLVLLCLSVTPPAAADDFKTAFAAGSVFLRTCERLPPGTLGEMVYEVRDGKQALVARITWTLRLAGGTEKAPRYASRTRMALLREGGSRVSLAESFTVGPGLDLLAAKHELGVTGGAATRKVSAEMQRDGRAVSLGVARREVGRTRRTKTRIPIGRGIIFSGSSLMLAVFCATRPANAPVGVFHLSPTGELVRHIYRRTGTRRVVRVGEADIEGQDIAIESLDTRATTRVLVADDGRVLELSIGGATGVARLVSVKSSGGEGDLAIGPEPASKAKATTLTAEAAGLLKGGSSQETQAATLVARALAQDPGNTAAVALARKLHQRWAVRFHIAGTRWRSGRLEDGAYRAALSELRKRYVALEPQHPYVGRIDVQLAAAGKR